MSYFVTQAIRNIWCTPAQDGQYIFKMKRQTPYLGFSSKYEVMTTAVSPPIAGVRFHLFSLSAAYPDLQAMVTHPQHWVKFSDCANQTKRVVDIYNSLGIRLPLSHAYFTYTTERMLLVAVQELPVVGVLGTDRLLKYPTDELYIRIYKNSYYSSTRWAVDQSIAQQTITDPVYVEGAVVRSSSDIIAIQNKIATYSSRIGKSLFYKNGFEVPSLTLVNVAVGDQIEWVYDASLTTYEDMGYIGTLPSFVSTQDQRGKYVLHMTQRMSSIVYQDDVVLIMRNGTTGIQIPRNAAWTLRNLTHQDFALRVDVLGSIMQSFSANWSVDNTKLVLYARKSGYERSLVDEHTRIKELYRLSDEKILNAMQGVDSNVPTWTANALESGSYASIMSSSYAQITHAMAVNAMGYNAIAADVAKPAVKVNDGSTLVNIPSAYQDECSSYWYDVNGYLLSYHNHQGVTVVEVDSSVKYVEFIRENYTDRLEEYLNVTSITLHSDRDYRYYIREASSNPQSNTWLPVSVDDARISIADSTMSWVGVSTQYDTLILSNRGVVVNDFMYPITDGLLAFNLTHKVVVNGQLISRELEVPPGELDIWLNGRYLIRNLDYHTDGAAVVVCAKQYISSAVNQHIVVRMKGLCKSDMSLRDSSEYGFVVDGVLSIDNEFDTRDDKANTIYIGGGMCTRDDVLYQEDNSVVYVPNSALNGKPYITKESIIRLTDLIAADSVDFRERSADLDKQISQYLTVHLPAAATPPAGTKASNHLLYSPIIAKILSAVSTQVIDNAIMSSQYSDNQVLELIQPYLYLYALDPIHVNNRLAAGLVDIHPTHLSTIVNINVWQYAFVNRVIRLLAGDLVSLSSHVQIS